VDNPNDKLQRTILPIPDVMPISLTTYDAKNPETKFPPIVPLRPPADAPNVLIILIDDVGFGASSAFGGPCQTPNFEKLATNGLKYTRFHTTALCSPTRAALLSGRNHHTVGMGSITELATSAPGQNSMRPNTCAPLAEVLKLNGYSTAQFGKCHEVPVWETSPLGPFTHWPTGGGGFEYFYGFIGGETNQYYPALFEGTTPVEQEKTPEQGYHFTEDLADKAIKWVRQQKSLAPDKPFFMYFAPGATHAPHHVPKEWSDKYKGKFDQGWDQLREQTFKRQKDIGVIPKDCQLTARHPEIPAWEAIAPEMKPVLARQMEIYAGFLEHTDHHVGRLIDALKDIEALQDTLIYVIIGDNGASAEGSLQGTYNEMLTLGGFAHLQTPQFLTANLDKFGGPESYNHYAVGWAHAMDTPYQWTKQVASHWGGTRNGTIVHWPRGIKAKSEIRTQFHHVMGRLTESSIVNTHNKSYAITAEVVVPDSGAEGVIVALGGLTGGWSLYAKGGRLKYCYNFFGLQRYYVESSSNIPAGTHQVRMEFLYDGGGVAKGGGVTLYVDGKSVGTGRIDQTEPILFSADETCDVGRETGSPVTHDYGSQGNRFSGEVNWVEIDLDKAAADADHIIKPEERLALAMAIQ
jgi:arylsulfatase A-like enzyme